MTLSDAFNVTSDAPGEACAETTLSFVRAFEFNNTWVRFGLSYTPGGTSPESALWSIATCVAYDAAPRLDGIDPVRSLCDRYTHRNLVFEPNAGIEPESLRPVSIRCSNFEDAETYDGGIDPAMLSADFCKRTSSVRRVVDVSAGSVPVI